MKNAWLYASLAAVLLIARPAAARECQYENGEARWPIKTSVPQDAAQGQVIDLASLLALKNTALTKVQIAVIEKQRWDRSVTVKDSSGSDVTVKEGDIITVDAYVYRARCQKDGDYHIEIGAGKARSSKCLIVELPDPDEIKDATLEDMVASARNKLESLDSSVFASHATKPPIKVQITGQLFYDAPHYRANDPSGGRGTVLNSGRNCASNLWELHPVIVITD
jgi:hypothetical protein